MSYDDTVVKQASSSFQGCTDAQTAFLQWFHRSGGSLNEKCRFADFKTLGTGLVADSTIDNDEVLFTIPRTMLLNVQNSQFPTICRSFDHTQREKSSSSSLPAWDDVNVGWNGLIMTMMWEQFRSSPQGMQSWQAFAERVQGESWMNIGAQGLDDEDEAQTQAAVEARSTMQWAPYFSILPTQFDTPMFWTPEELHELKGTVIPDKIGKEEASGAYYEFVRPYILSHPALFLGSLIDGLPPSAIEAHIDTFYPLEQFHIMGSRILSRSFHVKGDQGIGEGQGEGHNGVEDGEAADEEDGSDEDDDDDDDDENDDEGDESIEHVSMVPMADMLNARYGHDNARLFYKKRVLEMRSTRTIRQGEQVWNTYGEPPSSDLLRRYGYVDLGNPADVVEITLEDLVEARTTLVEGQERPTREQLLSRIEWACALGVDEVSPLSYPFPPSSTSPYAPPPIEQMSKKDVRLAALDVSDDLVVLGRVLCWSNETFEKNKAKDKLPNARIEAIEENSGGSVGVAQLLVRAIEVHEKGYATTLAFDEDLLFGQARDTLPLHKMHAIVVRMSEKRILRQMHVVFHFVVDALGSSSSSKRKADGASMQQSTHRKMKRS